MQWRVTNFIQSAENCPSTCLCCALQLWVFWQLNVRCHRMEVSRSEPSNVGKTIPIQFPVETTSPGSRKLSLQLALRSAATNELVFHACLHPTSSLVLVEWLQFSRLTSWQAIILRGRKKEENSSEKEWTDLKIWCLQSAHFPSKKSQRVTSSLTHAFGAHARRDGETRGDVTGRYIVTLFDQKSIHCIQVSGTACSTERCVEPLLQVPIDLQRSGHFLNRTVACPACIWRGITYRYPQVFPGVNLEFSPYMYRSTKRQAENIHGLCLRFSAFFRIETEVLQPQKMADERAKNQIFRELGLLFPLSGLRGVLLALFHASRPEGFITWCSGDIVCVT